MNKRLAASGLAVLTAAAMCLPASAHCHGQRAKAASKVTTCAVCTVEDCETLGRHTHDGVIYCGYDHEDGLCDGLCRALCQEEGCTQTGRHTHHGLGYCGTHHEDGFCDGSCLTAGTVRGHHRGYHH